MSEGKAFPAWAWVGCGCLGAILASWPVPSWSAPAPQTGSPMTYMLDGRQYPVIAVSGARYPGERLAFRLPQSRENP